MNRLLTIGVSAVGALLFSAPFKLAAQSVTSVSGEVISTAQATDPGWSVELRPLTENRSQPPVRAFLHSSGHFSISGVPVGTFHVVLLDPHQNEVKRDITTVAGYGPHVIQIRLGTPTGTARKAVGATISMRQLTHKVPKAANKEFKRAAQERDRHHPAKAEAHFLKALELDPEFIEAANDLGAFYYREGRYDDSLKTLNQALALEPDSHVVLANLGATLLALQRPADAEPIARRSMALDPTSIRSRYIFGLSRAAMGKLDIETTEALTEASQAIPHANLALARLHAAKGDRAAARQALERYIAASQPRLGSIDRAKAEGWLNSLK